MHFKFYFFQTTGGFFFSQTTVEQWIPACHAEGTRFDSIESLIGFHQEWHVCKNCQTLCGDSWWRDNSKVSLLTIHNSISWCEQISAAENLNCFCGALQRRTVSRSIYDHNKQHIAHKWAMCFQWSVNSGDHNTETERSTEEKKRKLKCSNLKILYS